MSRSPLQLHRDARGRLHFIDAEGRGHTGVVPVRAFPISAPEGGLSLVDLDGHEVLWIASLADVDASARTLIEEELALRDFMPVIQRIVSVSSFATPSTWVLETDRGPAELVLKGEEDIRRMGADTLLVIDRHGVNYLIRQPAELDRASRRLLDRFL